jgi:VWFA-related protein
VSAKLQGITLLVDHDRGGSVLTDRRSSLYGATNRAENDARRDLTRAKEEVLIRRVLGGDKDSFLDLIQPYQRTVYATMVSMLGNKEDAEDVTQDVLLKALARLHQFRQEDLQSRMLSASAKGQTALLDAVYLGLSQMRSARSGKRALLIISDGGDNSSRYSEKDIKRLVREADTQLYSIGIFEPFEYRARTPEELNGPTLLNEMTELTGGRAFAVANLDDLPDIAAKIGAELRNQYVLGYHPSNRTRDARWRKIKIKLRTPKGFPPLSVYAKTGYYAPAR